MMKRLLAIAAAAVLLATTVVTNASANARDPDGSRMQARQLMVGSAARDRLNPPRDSVDWHYFKLRKARVVSINVSGKPAAVPVRLRITNAVGKSLGGTTTRKGKASVKRRFDPGVYYVSVSAGKPVSYSLSVR